MREYETVFITQPNISETDQAKINDKLASLVERHSGKLFYARKMGKRTLAYAIAKNTKGFYTCLDYAADKNAVEELERNLRLEENVLRFLTVVKSDTVDVEARAAEVLAKGEGLPVDESQEVAVPVFTRDDNRDSDNLDKED